VVQYGFLLHFDTDNCLLKKFHYTYREFFFKLAIEFYMLIFQPPVNFCSDENIQTIFGTKLEDLLNNRIGYNSISQTVEKVVEKIFFSAPKASKSGDRQVLVEPTMALLWRPLDVLLFRRPKKYFFHNFFDSLGYSVVIYPIV
jgi:hypothetical protein